MDAYDPGQGYSYLGSIVGLVILLVILYVYHLIRVRYCLESSPDRQSRRPTATSSYGQTTDQLVPHENTTAAAVVELLPACKYDKEVVETVAGEEKVCAVCLSEFNQGEDVRVLPECLHTFHVPCIDMWLYSHSTCPLCRTAPAAILMSSKVVDGRPPDSGGSPESGSDLAPPPTQSISLAIN
ncbi:hypothetical protein H6P81_016209 [Aristolochia fimbriata]|uniref:RING-type E3 ubiquitin transferase n=1 Tax=Aristolochia fimbriata TaxID=158543 RepID=A0AAV7E8B4_ARIFI|nr:hypothetical protein H6P81_016209 [Aristolochia fimbriata]